MASGARAESRPMASDARGLSQAACPPLTDGNRTRRASGSDKLARAAPETQRSLANDRATREAAQGGTASSRCTRTRRRGLREAVAARGGGCARRCLREAVPAPGGACARRWLREAVPARGRCLRKGGACARVWPHRDASSTEAAAGAKTNAGTRYRPRDLQVARNVRYAGTAPAGGI
jgi:hypothetical protein